MTAPSEIQSLSDHELLSRLSGFVKQSRHVEAVLVAHLAEVDGRRLYAREGSSSMFAYCTDVLHLSEPVAQLRITGARACRRFPVILTMLEDGRLHLSAIGLLSKHLTPTNHEEVLRRATHKSKRQVEELVVELAPKPDVRPSIRKLPERRSPEPENTVVTAKSTSSGQSAREPAPAPIAPRRHERPKVEPLSPARYKVQFTANAELRNKLDRLAELVPNEDLASLIDIAVTEKLAKLEARRCAKVKKPRKRVEDADTTPGKRGISAPVARVVWARDGGQCTFVSKNGRRCPERRGLELHHDDPFGRGGDRGAGNIRLLCKAHNMYMAERDYGKAWMEQFRCTSLPTSSGQGNACDRTGSARASPSG